MDDTNVVGAAALALVDRMESAVTRPGLGRTDVAALIHVRQRPGETIQFLARVLGLTHSGGVRLVDRLEAEGLISSERGTDRRSVHLFLTAAGSREVTAALRRRERSIASILEQLTPGERASFAASVDKLLRGMTSDRWSARFICRMCNYPPCLAEGCPVDEAAALSDTG